MPSTLPDPSEEAQRRREEREIDIRFEAMRVAASTFTPGDDLFAHAEEILAWIKGEKR